MAQNKIVSIEIKHSKRDNRPQITFERINNSMGNRYYIRTPLRRSIAENIIAKYPHRIRVYDDSLFIYVDL